MKILFLHGWQSTPGGVKPSYLKDHGREVLSPSLRDDDFDAAVRVAQARYDRGKPDVARYCKSRGVDVLDDVELLARLRACE